MSNNNDPWEVEDERENGGRFAQSTITRQEKISQKTGKPFMVFEFVLTPLQPEYKTIVENYAPFWESSKEVVRPALNDLIERGVITKTTDIEGDHFIRWEWGEYKARSYKDIKYFQDNNPDRIGTDPYGQFVIKKAIKILDVFPDEATWRKAAQSDNPVAAIEQDEAMIQAALVALSSVIPYCGTDMTKLQTMFQNPPLNIFTVESYEVKSLVAGMIATKCGLDVDKQSEMIAEINSHFSESYLELNSPELMEQLTEIAF